MFRTLHKARHRQPSKKYTFRPFLEQLEKRELLSAASERFVNQIYRDLLGREADPGGMAGWSAFVDQGHQRSELVQIFEGSLEYRNRLVRGLYDTVVQRPADLPGLTGWSQALATGTTPEQLKTAFFASPEYFRTRGHGGNA